MSSTANVFFMLIVSLALARPLPVGPIPPQQPAAGFNGRWEGEVVVGGGAVTLPFAVVFSDSATGPVAAIDIQTVNGVPLRNVSVTAARVHFELPAGPGLAVFDGAFDAGIIKGTFTQGVATGTFTLSRAGTASPAVPAAPPPYRVADVTFANGAVTLAGTITIPEGAGPFPALVMITGSGPQNRDEELFGFQPFRVIADALTRRGIAVLRYDDRGVGGSTGSLAAATTADFSGDALAGLAMLAARPEIDHAHIGLLGHSEGADVAAVAAAHSPNVAFIVMMAGTALRGDVVLRHQAEDSVRALGASEAQVAAVVAAHQRVTEATRTGADTGELSQALRGLMRAQIEAQPAAVRSTIGDIDAYIDKALPAALAQGQSAWMKFFVGFDPATTLSQVKCPVLALFGERDTQVRPDLNRPPLEAAFGKGGNTRVTVKIYPEANHLFIKAVTGQVSEYAALPKVFVPGFLDDLANWVRSVTR